MEWPLSLNNSVDFSSYFEDLHFQLEYMEETVKNLVVVSASLTVTVAETTLRFVFPHLVGDELGYELLGRRLILPCSIWFEWNESTSLVERLETTVEFLMPISRVLSSITDAVFVLGQALVTRDGSIGKFDT